MHHTILATLAAVTLGTNTLGSLEAIEAEPNHETERLTTAVMGPELDYQQGLTVNDVAPTLRSVVVNGETILAYCIEYWVRAAAPDHQAAVTSWDGFTGDNHFKTDPQVREAVAWILRNSYPALSLQELSERTDTSTLTAPEAIAATQAAIWFYTDDFVSDGELTVEAAPDDEASMADSSAENVQYIFDYLTGDANVGLTEEEVQASVTLSDASSAEISAPEPILESVETEDDHLLGPVIINSSSAQVDLHLESTDPAVSTDEITLFDVQGQVLDPLTPVEVPELWVHVPAETASGELHIAAESTEHSYTGKLIIPEPAPDRRFQTIVVVEQTPNIASTELLMSWEKTEATEPPAKEPIPEPPSVDEETPEEIPPNDEPTLQVPPVEDRPSPEGHTSDPTPQPTEIKPSEKPLEIQQEVIEPQNEELVVRTEDETTEELAETGAHQTRNVLVALATLATGAILLLVNRLRRRYT